MSDWRSRLFDEYEEVSQNLDKLRAFILSDAYDALPDIARSELKEQMKHMDQCRLMLSLRVSRECGSA